MTKQGAKNRGAKRRQKTVERRRVKRQAIQHQLLGTKRDESLPGLDDWPEDDHLFWVCHGANYLASDYNEAIWRPVFPGLYEGRTYTEEGIVKRVMAHFNADLKDDEGYSVGKAVVAWAIQDKATHYSFQRQCVNAATKNHPDADVDDLIQQPHQSDVWRVFDRTKALLQQRT